MEQTPIYQIKVTLRDSTPPIWRRIQVKGDTKLDELHDILQIAMGWTDSHLHTFRREAAEYGVPDPDFPDSMEDECSVRLDRIATEGETIIYEYDFGDGWEHDLEIEKVIAPEPGVYYPRCFAGERACPPEDCGGVWGYENMLQILNDPDHEEYEEIREWMGEDFDPEAFDLEEINQLLKELLQT